MACIWIVSWIELYWLWRVRPENGTIAAYLPIATLLSPMLWPRTEAGRWLLVSAQGAIHLAVFGSLWHLSEVGSSAAHALLAASWGAFGTFFVATVMGTPWVRAAVLSTSVGVVVFATAQAPRTRTNEAGTYSILLGGGTDRIADGFQSLRPHTVFRDYFRDNSRGYFEEEPLPVAEAHRRWRYRESGRASGRMSLASEGGSIVCRIEVRKADPKSRDSITASYAAGELLPRQFWRISLQVRGSSTRQVTVRFRKVGGGETVAAPSWSIPVRPDARRYHWEFSSPSSEGAAEVELEVGDREGWLEWTEFEVRANTDGFHPRPMPVAWAWYLGYETNADGFRGGDFTARARTSSHRIVCLGGSGVFGRGLKEADTFSRLLETTLRGLVGKSADWEVFNLGTPGHRMVDSRPRLERFHQILEPRIVVMALESDAETPEWMGASSGERPEGANSGGESETERIVSSIESMEEMCRRCGATLVVLLFADPMALIERERITEFLSSERDRGRLLFLDLSLKVPTLQLSRLVDVGALKSRHALVAAEVSEILRRSGTLDVPAVK